MELSAALRARRSVRGFHDRQVPRETLAAVFADAQHAPSWCNIQPWRVFVTGGDTTRKLTDALTAAATSQAMKPDFPWPGEYPEPYGRLRRECGKALYVAMGVARDDGAGRHAAWMRNYVAFGAPHVAMVAMDRRWGLYAALDVGCWLQSVLLAAVDHGLATCPQAALGTYPDAARAVLGIPDELGILCGIAIGYEDAAVPANACRTSREPLESSVQFIGF